MAELLFVTPQEMASNTILSGNIDIDKFLYCIAKVQVTVVEPLLGSELYDKIVSDITVNTLTGKYKVIYDEFIKPITKHAAVAEYIAIASYMVDNGGIYKHAADGKEVVSKDEVQFLAGGYRSMAQSYVSKFYKYIRLNIITEYKNFQDEVNAIKDINVLTGWKL